MTNLEHLGSNVYVCLDGEKVVITNEFGRNSRNTIVIRGEVINSLVEWLIRNVNIEWEELMDKEG